MSNVRIIVKQTIQPPIDTPAAVCWHTVDLEADALADLLNGVGVPNQNYSVFEVVGAELLPKDSQVMTSDTKVEQQETRA